MGRVRGYAIAVAAYRHHAETLVIAFELGIVDRVSEYPFFQCLFISVAGQPLHGVDTGPNAKPPTHSDKIS